MSQIKDPKKAWALVLDHQEMVLDTIAWQLSQSLGRAVTYRGSWPNVTWWTTGWFFGQEALDYVEDAVPELLEAAAIALERRDSTRGTARTAVNTYMKNAAIDIHENVTGSEPAVPFLRQSPTGEGEKTVKGEAYYGAGVLEDEYAGEFIDKPDEVDAISTILTEEEAYAVGREGDGASLTEIAEDLDQFFPLPDGSKRSRFQARNVLDRALRRMRKAVQV